MPDESKVEVKLEKKADFKSVRDAVEKLQVDIEVGFLSGNVHFPEQHKKKGGKYKAIDGGEPNLEGIDTADLARALHYGTSKIPPRPFLEEGLERAEDEIEAAFSEEIDAALSGQKPSWGRVGSLAVGKIQELVRSDWYKSRVPNSKATQEWKGSDTPLIDSARMINSLTYIVDGKRS